MNKYIIDSHASLPISLLFVFNYNRRLEENLITTSDELDKKIHNVTLTSHRYDELNPYPRMTYPFCIHCDK